MHTHTHTHMHTHTHTTSGSSELPFRCALVVCCDFDPLVRREGASERGNSAETTTTHHPIVNYLGVKDDHWTNPLEFPFLVNALEIVTKHFGCSCSRHDLGANDGRDSVAPAARMRSNTLTLRRQQRYIGWSHDELRNENNQRGFKNSRKDSSSEALRAVLEVDDEKLRPPLSVFVKEKRDPEILNDYEREVELTTLTALSNCFPDAAWQHYLQQGWVTFDMQLTAEEKRMINSCHRVLMAELGVNPTRADTYRAAKDDMGYDYAYGWLRNPSLSASQFYLATHPRMWRHFVGFYARYLLHTGTHDDDDPEAVKACLELAMQVYNAKLKLPGDSENSFAHTDFNWKRREGVDLPMPQCAVFTSPNQVDDQEIFQWRFVDISSAGARAKTSAEMKAKHQEQLDPYEYGVHHGDRATGPPDWAERLFSTNQASVLGQVNPGKALIMTQLTVHEITQRPVRLSSEQIAGNEPVDIRYTRTGEFPLLWAKKLFGRVNQSSEEVSRSAVESVNNLCTFPCLLSNTSVNHVTAHDHSSPQVIQ